MKRRGDVIPREFRNKALCSCGSKTKVHDHKAKLRKYLARHYEAAKASAFGVARLEARARKGGFKSLSQALGHELEWNARTASAPALMKKGGK